MGDLGEILFFEAHCRDMVRLDGFKSDFQCKTSGDTVELKTDFYSFDETPNFFFERISNESKGSPGGPWQSLANGTDTFVYFFVKELTYFKFNVATLVTRLEEIIPTLKPVPIANKNFTTIGYRVPRTLVEDIAEKVSLSVKRKKAKP